MVATEDAEARVQPADQGREALEVTWWSGP